MNILISKRVIFLRYIVNIAVALAVGGLSSILTSGSMKSFASDFVQAPLTPPSAVFPIVWSVLYILMAIGYTRISKKDCEKGAAYYWLQLAFNFFWSIWFFNANAFLFSFFWLLALVFLVILMAWNFYKCDKLAGIMQLPYIIWLLFAGYLNITVYILNRI